jgi:predicted porin
MRFFACISVVLCAWANTCHAEAALSGALDFYVEHSTTPGQSVTKMDSSGLSVSRLVFKADEMLGADMAVRTYLEVGITPTADANADTPLLRQSFIALSGPYGKIALGKQFSPHLWLLGAEFDVLGTSFWATPYTIFQGGSRYARVPGSVFVESPALLRNHVTLSAMWARRDMTDGAQVSGNQAHLSIRFDLSPHWRVGLITVRDQAFSRTEPEAKLLLVGLNYDDGIFRLAGGVQQLKIGVSQRKVNEFCIGAAYLIDRSNQILMNFARSYERGATGKSSDLLGLTWIYNLSKRVAVYSSWGRLRNGQAYDNSFDLPVKAGASSRNIMLGIRQSF